MTSRPVTGDMWLVLVAGGSVGVFTGASLTPDTSPLSPDATPYSSTTPMSPLVEDTRSAYTERASSNRTRRVVSGARFSRPDSISDRHDAKLRFSVQRT